MSDWTSGYVADIGYTYGYYAELNPLRIKLAFLRNALIFPEVGTACELGFGQGVGTNIHAAASITQWSGTDFNPAQAGFAQELARASKADVKLYDQAFDEFCSRNDLPEFDYIALHGIWSWISDENRMVIVDFIRRKLKVGGVLYISYNTQPGWAAMVPMRDLMTEHAEVMGSHGEGIVNRVDSALKFAEQLLAVNPTYARANPQIIERIQKIKGQNRLYVAHEYFNRHWQPMSFAKMAEWLESAKVQFACSADYLDDLDSVNLTQEQQVFLSNIKDSQFRQTVRDFCINQQFRKDYWVKGVRKMSALEQTEKLRELRFVQAKPRTDISLRTQRNLGEIRFNEAIYNPVLDAFTNFEIKSLGQLEQVVKTNDGHPISLQQLSEVVTVLSYAGVLLAVQDDWLIAQAQRQTDALNRKLIIHAKSSSEINYLASPVSGGGVDVSRFQQLFILALQQGARTPNELAQFVWEVLSSQGEHLLKGGQAIETAEGNLAELIEQAATFIDMQLPILKALKIVKFFS